MSNVNEAGVPSCVAGCRDICMRVAIRAGMAESVPSGLLGSSVSQVEGGAPRAANGSSPFGILHCKTGGDGVGEANCSCSNAPRSCRLMAMAMSLGGSMVSAREGDSTGVVVGTGMAVVTLTGCTLLKSTSISCGCRWVHWEWQCPKEAAPGR